MKKLFPLVLIVCSLIITGSVSAYFLYILPQIENAKFKEEQLIEAPVTDLEQPEEVEPENPSNDIKQAEVKSTTKSIVKEPEQTIPPVIVNEPQPEIVEEPKVEPAEDPAIKIERCKSMADEIAAGQAYDGRKEYLDLYIPTCSDPGVDFMNCVNLLTELGEGLYNNIYNDNYPGLYQICLNDDD